MMHAWVIFCFHNNSRYSHNNHLIAARYCHGYTNLQNPIICSHFYFSHLIVIEKKIDSARPQTYWSYKLNIGTCTNMLQHHKHKVNFVTSRQVSDCLWLWYHTCCAHNTKKHVVVNCKNTALHLGRFSKSVHSCMPCME